MTLDEILARHDVHTADDFEREINLGNGDLENDLYQHYANNGEMPYGTMKARTGDPGEFIYYQTVDYLEKYR